MLIDNKNLHEVTLKKIKVIAPDEHFYAVPNASEFALSTYGRLFKTTPDGRCKREKILYHKGKESYTVHFDDSSSPRIIPIRKLMELVFFPELDHVYLMNPKTISGKYRWKLEDLHVLQSKSDIVEFIVSKIERREPQYDGNREGCTFKNRADFNKPLRAKAAQIYWNMHSRSVNPKVKGANPQYENTSISESLTFEVFNKWYIANFYDYPGKLSIDKDILGLGLTNRYEIDKIALVPVYINNVFTKSNSQLGYCIYEKTRKDGKKYYKIPGNAFTLDSQHQKDILCATYSQALREGRKRKADYIRAIIQKEQDAGYMPKHILDAMEKWADLCELGLVKKWEPSEETLVNMGVI